MQNGKSAWVKLLVVLVGIAVIASTVMVALKEHEKREQKRLALLSAKRGADEVHSDLRKSLASSEGITQQQGIEALEKLQKGLASSVALEGEEGKVLKAVSDFLGEKKALSIRIADATAKVGGENAFNLAEFTSREVIAERKRLAQELLVLNSELAAFQNGSSARIRQLLLRQGIGAAKADDFVKEHASKRAKSLPLQNKILAAEAIMWKSFIEICDLLDEEWGKWEMTEEGPKFATDAVLARFNAIGAKALSADEEHSEAERQMLQLPKE